MKPERWQQIDRLLDSALEREASQRAVFLEQACAGDEELRREVEALDRPWSFRERSKVPLFLCG